jgi:hypothetical protein
MPPPIPFKPEGDAVWSYVERELEKLRREVAPPVETWEPVFSSLVNLSSAVVLGERTCWYQAFYTHVVCWGVARIDAVTGSGTQTSFEISLPIASNFINVTDLTGLFNFSVAQQGGVIVANTTSNLASFVYAAEDTTVRNIRFQFTYMVGPNA